MCSQGWSLSAGPRREKKQEKRFFFILAAQCVVVGRRPCVLGRRCVLFFRFCVVGKSQWRGCHQDYYYISQTKTPSLAVIKDYVLDLRYIRYERNWSCQSDIGLLTKSFASAERSSPKHHHKQLRLAVKPLICYGGLLCFFDDMRKVVWHQSIRTEFVMEERAKRQINLRRRKALFKTFSQIKMHGLMGARAEKAQR